ncbi:ABC transporter permease (plasmid) [Pseudochrobactrum algeriensis]|jgi:peptide/nickel transport system permease protein|uniref:Peptide/nickel transport system permease protein n=2 Tax=Pseudochrobactrum TaxID=354349 RepID=A0A7W8ALN1_9HYPH|nr:MULTISPECIES: ABC transporter permease [Pseudochrobactrum]MBJ6721815.1 ABC transporter permease [Bacillus sp. PR5]MBX8785169.1 ABC transporter permease [Ochrobactrum sp. GRS2]MBX8800124.1 ABC transporter permease [Ochrobactrum sp. MR28]MBX8812465.1 ABC transporter permease [Ochrobactrum sp. MR34]MBX8817418.1 ABC transporter permease [Ochrobactrum sp. MR31]MDR2310303.1 ABC transporter permease [Brucellaceae bacterium]
MTTFSSIPTAEQILEPSPSAILRRRIFGHSGFMIGTIIVAVIALVAIFAPMLLKYDPYTQDLLNRMVPPEFLGGKSDHVLGTDQLGRDYLARLLHGARVSLFIGLSAALISGIIGTAMGVAAGYFGGRVDAVVTFLINVRLAMPVVLVALAVVALFGGSLTVVATVLGLLLWDRYAVVMRASTLQIARREYVAASYAIGTSTPRILISEILPNLMNNLIVVATLEMAHAILLEAALSFLGLGVQPPTASWGLMISEGKDMMLFEPWLVMIPGVALFVLVLAINLMGDGLRDITAPGGRN